jgi:hypothetical protein
MTDEEYREVCCMGEMEQLKDDIQEVSPWDFLWFS